MKRWTDDEIILLQEEAERLARAGHVRPDISRQLGVPLHTLARWAFEGHWREKDLLQEKARACAEAMRQRIAARRAREAGVASRFGAVSRAALLETVLETKSADPPETPEPDSSAASAIPSGGPKTAGQHPLDRLREIWAEEDDNPPWSDRAPLIKTPPWAPGGKIEDPASCALYLADDLMRQGLLVEAGRALRFVRDWTREWDRATDRWNKQDLAEERRQEKADLQSDLDGRWAANRAAATATTTGAGAL